MRLLVTRPDPDAARTAAKLAALGHQTLVDPLLTCEVLPTAPLDAPPAGLIVTSRNGVRALLRRPEAVSWHGLPVFAVGDATAAALEEAGFVHTLSAAGDAAALARLVERSFPRDRGPLLHVAAEEAGTEPDARLRAQGFTISRLVAYRMQASAALSAPARNSLAAGTIGGVLLYSSRTAAVFVGLASAAGLEKCLADVVLYALSARIADAAARLPWRAIAVPPVPDEESLFGLLPLGAPLDGDRG